jgi:O-antigen ligase
MLSRIAPPRAEGLLIVGGLGLAAGAGVLAGRYPIAGLVLLVVVAAVVATVALEERALPYFVVIGAVIPYFPARTGFEGEPIVPVGFISCALIAAVLGPFLWSVAARRVRRPMGRGEVLVAFASLVVIVMAFALRRQTAILTLATGGFVAGLVAYLCAKRFTRIEDWGLPSFLGLCCLVTYAVIEYSGGVDDRVGFLVGYPILYAVLVLLLLPPAVGWAYRRSVPLAAVAGLAGVVVLIFSQTRSAWLGFIVVTATLAVLLFRWGRPRALVALFAGVVVISTAVVVNSDLSKLVENRLSRENVQTSSFTHREYSYGYTLSRFLEAPIAGRGWPGALKEDISTRTGLSAADNGFLSLAGDLGILGICLALVPVGVAVAAVARLWRTRKPDFAMVALMLSLVGALVATLFFDSFYWPQSAVLIFGMAGALHGRLAAA